MRQTPRTAPCHPQTNPPNQSTRTAATHSFVRLYGRLFQHSFHGYCRCAAPLRHFLFIFAAHVSWTSATLTQPCTPWGFPGTFRSLGFRLGCHRSRRRRQVLEHRGGKQLQGHDMCPHRGSPPEAGSQQYASGCILSVPSKDSKRCQGVSRRWSATEMDSEDTVLASSSPSRTPFGRYSLARSSVLRSSTQAKLRARAVSAAAATRPTTSGGTPQVGR